MGRPFSFVVPVVVAGALLAGCGGGDDRSVSIGQVDDTTTTTTTTAAPLISTPPASQPACTEAALVAAYEAKYGAAPANRSLSILRCLAGWGLASLDHSVDAPIFVLFHIEGGAWVAKSKGVAHVCQDQGVPPNIAPQIGCDT